MTWPPPQGLQEGARPARQTEKGHALLFKKRSHLSHTVYNSTLLKKINHLGSFHTHMLNPYTGEGKLCPLHAVLPTPARGVSHTKRLCTCTADRRATQIGSSHNPLMFDICLNSSQISKKHLCLPFYYKGYSQEQANGSDAQGGVGEKG